MGQLTPLSSQLKGVNGTGLFVQSPNGMGVTVVAWEATLVPHGRC